MHRLAAAIDAALGIDEGVDGTGNGAPLDAAVGQVEGGLGEVDEAVVALGALRHDEGWRVAAFAIEEPAVEGGRAVVIRGGGGQHLVVARDEADIRALHRLRRRDGADRDPQRVAAAGGGEAEVGDHEPLRGDLVPFLDLLSCRLRGHHIESGFELAQRLVDREGGGHLLVERRWRVHLAGPDFLAQAVGDVLRAIAADLLAEVRVHHAGDQVAVTDAVERQLGLWDC